MASIFEYRIHPTVGIARMGDSQNTYFLVGEKPLQHFDPQQQRIPGGANKVVAGSKMRDADGKLCKQGTKFRVFCYEFETEGPAANRKKGKLAKVWECKKDEYEINWTASVANLKASHNASPRTSLPNIPAPVTLRSTVTAEVGQRKTFVGKRSDPAHPDNRLDLGSCFLDSDHNLVVLGSEGSVKQLSGSSAAPIDGLFWPDWEDDEADGPISAKIKPKANNGLPDAGKPESPALGAWVVISMPDYAGDVRATTTLYDVAINHASINAKNNGLGEKVNPEVGMTYHSYIKPLLMAMYGVPYVIRFHGSRSPYSLMPFNAPNDPKKLNIGSYLRKARETLKIQPENIWTNPSSFGEPGNSTNATLSVGPQTMPMLLYTTVTQLQYDAVQLWMSNKLAEGNNVAESSSMDSVKPYQLDRANLESMSGGSFFPGIEVGRQAFWPKTWRARKGAWPGHIDARVERQINDLGNDTGAAGAGYLTKELANPWQADFVACSGLYWPHSRPITVQHNPNAGAANRWKDWMTTKDPSVTATANAGSSQPIAPYDKTKPIVGGKTSGGLISSWARLGFVRFDSVSNQMIEMERDNSLGIQ
jgi:hypothetical protein